MRIYIFTFWICLLLISGCADEPTISRLSSDAVIMAFGDSLTYGSGARNDESYPTILSKLSGRKVINAGISGEESAQGLQRLPALLEKNKPQLLILCHGGNDILRKKDKNKMEANVRQMIRLAQTKNIPVVLLGVPKPGLFLSSAEVYAEIAESMGVVFIEDLISEVLKNNALKSDRVHPNKEGYRVIAEQIFVVLQEVGAI